MLEKAKVKSVPILVHKQQVQTPHPITQEFVNHSMHTLHTLLHRSSQASYYLHVLSHLVSKPRGYPIFNFNLLAELLVGLINCLCGASKLLSPTTANLHLAAHHDALKQAHILHCDISLFNLLLVLAMHNDVWEGFLDQVLKGPEKDVVRAKIQKLSCHGLLANWGYAIPIDYSQSGNPSQGDDTDTTGICISGKTEPVSRTNLKDMHNILIPMANEPIPSGTGSSINTSPLHHMVSF